MGIRRYISKAREEIKNTAHPVMEAGRRVYNNPRVRRIAGTYGAMVAGGLVTGALASRHKFRFLRSAKGALKGPKMPGAPANQVDPRSEAADNIIKKRQAGRGVLTYGSKAYEAEARGQQ